MGVVHHLLAWGHASLPRLYSRLAPVVMRHAGFLDEPPDDAPRNVFEPMPEWNRCEGGWRNGALRRWLPAGAGVIGAGAAALAERRLRA